MKILYYIEASLPTFVQAQIEQMSTFHQVVCCTSKAPGKDASSTYDLYHIPFVQNSLEQRVMRFLELHDLYLRFKNRKFKKAFLELQDSFKPDVIHCQFGYDALKVLDNCFNESVNFVITFRGYDASNKLMSRRYRERLQHYFSKPNVSSIFVCSYLLRNLQTHGLNLPKRVAVIYSNTDTNKLRRSKRPESRVFRFIQISSTKKKKGHEYTIAAFCKFLNLMEEDYFELQLSGIDVDSPRGKEILLEIEQQGVTRNVRVTGKLSRKEVKDALENSHVALQHSITTQDEDQEGIPNFLMEAMSMELPIISTKHAGIPELLSPKEDLNVQLVEERDIEAYALAMQRITKNWSLSNRNRRRIEAQFSKNRFGKELNKFYQDL